MNHFKYDTPHATLTISVNTPYQLLKQLANDTRYINLLINTTIFDKIFNYVYHSDCFELCNAFGSMDHYIMARDSIFKLSKRDDVLTVHELTKMNTRYNYVIEQLQKQNEMKQKGYGYTLEISVEEYICNPERYILDDNYTSRNCIVFFGDNKLVAHDRIIARVRKV